MNDSTNPPEGSDSWREERRAYRQHRREMRRAWRQDHWESRIFGALTIIIVGVIFLLNTTGVVSWNVWLRIFSYWPLFIVSAGISIIFSGSRILRLIGSIITFFIFIAVLTLAVLNPFNTVGFNLLPAVGTTQALQSVDIVKQADYPDVKTQSLNVDLPIGETQITDAGVTDFMNLVTNYYVTAEKPLITKSVDQGVLALGVTTDQTQNTTFDFRSPKYTVLLGQPTIPASVNLKFGAGSGTMVLDKQLIKDFNAEVGAGSLDIRFSSAALPTQSLSLKSGVGNIHLALPATVGLKVNYKVGLGSLKVDGHDVTNGAGNSTFYSANYNVASANVTLNVEVGLGSIEIVTN